MFVEGRCTLESGDPVRPSTRVATGDVLVVRRIVRDLLSLPDRYEVLLEDDRMYVVDKPAGMPVHPTSAYLRNTLVTLARRAVPSTPPRLCHRLDRETSGVVIMAKDIEAQRHLMRQFERREVAKTYVALVWGRPDPADGVIDAPLRLSRVSRIQMKMEVVAPGDHGTGLPSRTRYRTLALSGRFALVECRPETGRQHQIRVHMTHAGHPLVGDKIYGVDERVFLGFIGKGLGDDVRESLLLPRHALHAGSVTFRHPGSGLPTTVGSPLPADIRDVSQTCPDARCSGWPAGRGPCASNRAGC